MFPLKVPKWLKGKFGSDTLSVSDGPGIIPIKKASKVRPDFPNYERPLKTYYRTPEGGAWNPLVGYPRNKGCFCGSGTKAKRCCLPHVMRCVSVKLATEISKNWARLMTGHYTLPKSPQSKG